MRERERSEKEEGLWGRRIVLYLFYVGLAGPVDDDGMASRCDHLWRHAQVSSAGVASHSVPVDGMVNLQLAPLMGVV